MTTLVLEQHIVATPSTRSGKPHIANTRITVSDVVVWHFRMGYSLDEIAVKWNLSLSALYAAISYYFDYKEEIDTQLEQANSHHANMRASVPSKLQEKLKVLRSE